MPWTSSSFFFWSDICFKLVESSTAQASWPGRVRRLFRLRNELPWSRRVGLRHDRLDLRDRHDGQEAQEEQEQREEQAEAAGEHAMSTQVGLK